MVRAQRLGAICSAGTTGLAVDDTLYRCHDRLLAHKAALFSTHLQDRWRDLFNAKFDVLLYDLTSTSCESDPPESKDGLRRFGYSRDKRADCVQVVIALIVTPEGFPLGSEVLAGNMADNTTLEGRLARIETQDGKAEPTWLMDRGIPDQSRARKDAHEHAARTLFGRHAQGTPEQTGARTRQAPVAAGAPWRAPTRSSGKSATCCGSCSPSTRTAMLFCQAACWLSLISPR